MKKTLLFSFIAVSLFVSCSERRSEPTSGELEENFLCPPSEARPRVWWHWMNGNITKDGALKDIEWMKRVGLGGFQTFDAALTTPQVVDERIAYMTDEWKDVFRTVTEKAYELGLEMAIAGSPGWSESGGPWVKPEQGMKKLVWSEIDLEGGVQFDGILPHPPTTTGSFQNISSGGGGYGMTSTDVPKPEYYKDVAVLAMKMPLGYSSPDQAPIVKSSAGTFSLTELTDGDLATTSSLPYDEDETSPAWIQYEFDYPRTVYGITVVGGVEGGGFGGFGGFGGPAPASDKVVLEVSQDGKAFTRVTSVGGSVAGVTDVNFNPVKGRVFRLSYKNPGKPKAGGGGPNPFAAILGEMGLGPMGNFGNDNSPKINDVKVAEFRLHFVPRVERYIEKAGFTAATGLDKSFSLDSGDEDSCIRPEDVLDITHMMKADGSLSWTPDNGIWKVIRFGYSLTGHQNSPASPEATGLEVDKMDPEAVREYFTRYLDMYKDATGGLMGKKGLHYIITDSWEAGTLNWTDRMFEEFEKNAGYDLHRWMPALAGYVIGDPNASDKFLWDFRKTIGDLTVKNHYDLLTDLLDKRGMARYSESHEAGRAFVADGMQVKRSSEVPMSAMWTPMGGIPGGYAQGGNGADIRESASVAHIYGQKYVAAESLTANGNAWGWCPETLKYTADMELASGLNRFVIHESAHQPLDNYKPGLTLGPFGQWFNRHETWAEEAGAWIDYLARSSYMLSQGLSVADILYFYGEDTNITSLYGNALPHIPEGYNFDFVDAQTLKEVIGVKDGLLTTPAGTTYKVLVLGDNTSLVSLPVLEAIEKLVRKGATLIGSKPLATPSLSDDDARFNSLADKLWEGGEFTSYGKGKVFGGGIDDAFEAISSTPDVTYSKPNPDTKILFVHRQLDKTQIYWLGSRTENTEEIDVSFRVSGMEPEIWDPVTGKISKVSYKMDDSGTTARIHFGPMDAVFVVFRHPTDVREFTLPAVKIDETDVAGAWTVEFVDGLGVPPRITFDVLTDWTAHPDKFIQYYSGSAIYKKQITLDGSHMDGEVWLNLGSVKNLARVVVNGKDLGVVWKTPFRVDISSAAHEGENDIEVKVVNLWVNRMIGDQRKDAGSYTHTTQVFHRAGEALLPSGLIGPVRIETIKQ